MALSSEFIILRRNKNVKKPISNIALQLIKKNWITANLIIPPEQLHIAKTVDFIEIEESSHEYISVLNRFKYIELMNVHFNSALSVLKRYYYLNPFTEHSQIIIDLNSAKLMKQAVLYLLSRNYSFEFEQILDNNYVSVFSELIPIYTTIKYKQEFDLELEEESIEGFNILKRILSVVNSYITLESENDSEEEYLLIYNVM